jgi:LysM repeat protein
MATNTCVAAREARTPRFLTYVVQANDRLSDILAKHDVTLSTLLQCNPSLSRKVPGQPTSIDEPDFLRIATIGLHVGDMLMIPIPVDAEEHGEA